MNVRRVFVTGGTGYLGRPLVSSGVPATVLRPWYVLGPGRRRPCLLKPLYFVCERLPPTRETALRLGFVTRTQMIDALVRAVEAPAEGFRVVTVPEIRAASPGETRAETV